MGKLGDLMLASVNGKLSQSRRDAKAKELGLQLDSMQRNLSQVATLTRGSEITQTIIVRDSVRSTVFDDANGWSIDGDGNATFRSVTAAGAITATSGAIGGWVVGATSLADAAGAVGMSSAATVADDIRFWAGNATPASAPFRVTEAGALTATNATLGGSLLITNTTDRIHLQSDGDAFFGTNIAAPATTTVSIFSNAQTYNGEAMGAGDVMFGDNSAGKANMLWDASDGKILVRGAATTRGYIDADGIFTFGAGAVWFDNYGITLAGGSGSANSLKWNLTTAGQSYGYIITDIGGTTPNRRGEMLLVAQGESSGTGSNSIELQAYHSGDADEYSLVDIGDDELTAIGNAGGTATNNAPIILQLYRFTNGIPAAGFGLGLEFYPACNLSGAGVGVRAADITAAWVDATYATRKSSLTLSVTSAGAKERLRLGVAETVVNESGDDVDFRVEGDTDANLMVADGGLDKVGIGLAAPKTKLTVEGALTLKEQAAADADTAAYGQVWVKTATPNQLWFTDDAGTATQLDTAGRGARVYRTAVQEINNDTETSILFTDERWDTDGCHDTSTNTSRLTCNTAGTYIIGGNLRFEKNATGFRAAMIRLNGTTRIAVNRFVAGTNAQSPMITVSTVYQLAATDYVELRGDQDSGGALDIEVLANATPEFWMERIA